MTTQPETYSHELYTYVEDKKQADAIAYASVNPEKSVFFPYKQPELKSDEIRAVVLYAGLCYSDVLHVRQLWKKELFPLVPGHEIVAQVVEMGKDVTNFSIGEKVAFGTFRNCCEKCQYCKNGQDNVCVSLPKFHVDEKLTYGLHFGGYSTQIQQPASYFFKLKENAKLELTAPLLCAGIAVYSPIIKYAKSGMKTAVVGIGGLGHLAVQFLHKIGLEVDAITTSPQNKDLYTKLGASNIVDSRSKEDLAKYKDKYDLIINTTPSGKNFNDLLDLTAPFGVISQVGSPGVALPVEFVPIELILKEISIVGSIIGSRKVTQDMLDFCIDKEIYPICEEFSFEDFPKAFEKLEHGKPFFRCVVNCGEYAKKNDLFRKPISN